LKRLSFEHERELRIIYYDSPNAWQLGGIWPAVTSPLAHHSLLVDLSGLIESVWISPKSEKWLVKPVEELLRTFGLANVQVERSALYDPLME
jgi:hypothetical protein